MKDNALYLEADEDITSAVDKLQKLSGSSAQIVVPKRSTMLQSVINLKLLKKAAADAGKELVLVTNDRLAADLAARIGLAVAPSLGAKAVVGEAAAPAPRAAEDIIEDGDDQPAGPLPEAAQPVAVKPAPKRPVLFARKKVGEGTAAAPTASSSSSGSSAPASAAMAINPLELPPTPNLGLTSEPEPDAAVPAAKPAHGARVPDFNRLQRRLLWVGLAVVLVVGYFAAMYFYASAHVTLYAAGSKVQVDTTFTADPALHQSDPAKSTLAAQTVTFTKDLSGPFTPTGKRDLGTKAHGTVTLKNCEDTNVYPFAAGNALTSASGLVFTTDNAVTIPAGSFSGGGANCTSATVTVPVTAAANGDNYNLAATTFTSSKLTANFKLSSAAQMSGGTSKTVNVVTQADVDAATASLLSKDKDGAQRDLAGRVPTGYVPLDGTDQQATASATASPAVDQEAATATLSLKVTYTKLAVLKADYQDFLRAAEQKQIGDQNQILDDGLSSAKITAGDRDATGRQTLHLSAEAYGGAKLDQSAIAKQLQGKRYGDATDYATHLPGVQRADVTLWPAWSSNLPARASKIAVDIKIAGAQGK